MRFCQLQFLFFYPVKRSLENVVLVAASVSPATRAAFRTDLTETRFKEAQGLIVSKSSASGLSTFIDEVQGTQLEVASLKNDTERGKAEEKLINKLEEYQAGLSILEAKTEQAIITYQFQEVPTVTPTSAPIPPTPIVTPNPTPQVINAEPPPKPSSTPIPTLAIAPTTTINLQTAPQEAVQISESVQVLEQKKIAKSLKEAKEQLDKIKKDLEEERREEKEKREERNESERKGKHEKEKKDSSDREK